MILSGKAAIVTASTSGIGLAIAKQYLVEGCNVLLSSRKLENVQRAVRELEPVASKSHCRVLGIQCDLLNDDNLVRLVEEAVKQFGKLDILVAQLAGPHYIDQQIVKTSDEDWDKVFAEYVRPARRLAQLALPHMESRGGSIIFVSHSSAYTFSGPLGLFPVAKATLIASMKAIANQVGVHGIRVNCVTPGIINTDFTNQMRANREWSEIILKNTALRRFGETLDVAGAAVFLASDYSSYISGESLLVAGGLALSHF